MKSNLNEQKKVGSGLSSIALMVLALAACGEKPPSPPPPQHEPPKLFQQERGALDKARGVGQTEAKSAEDLKQEAEKQTQ